MEKEGGDGDSISLHPFASHQNLLFYQVKLFYYQFSGSLDQ